MPCGTRSLVWSVYQFQHIPEVKVSLYLLMNPLRPSVTLDRSFVIIDESQNITMNLFKSIITRIGDDSKMVFLGDIEQVDFDQEKKRKQSALQHIIDIFKDEDYIGYCHFNDDEVVRNPIIPKVIQKLRDWNDK